MNAWAFLAVAIALEVTGIFAFDEKLGLFQYLCILLVLVGALGLRLTIIA